jgi:hypothetical protein
MDRFLALLLAAALGGAGGGFLVHTMAPSGSGGGSLGASGGPGSQAALVAQLEGIERRLDTLGAGTARGPGLKPGAAALEGTAPRSAPLALDEGAVEALAAQLAVRMKDSVKDAVEEAGLGTRGQAPRRAERKRVSLAAAAKELELSTSQEEALRELYTDMESKVFKMLAGENGDPEEVRRDVEMAKADKSKTFEVVGKYMPKALGNLGGFMALEGERQARTQEIVGPDKARRLQNEFSIEEQDPFGMNGGFQFQAGN